MLARFARLAVLALLAWQAVVVQAHGHGGPRLIAAGVHVTARQAPFAPRPDHAPDCLLCREVAHAGAYLPPAAPGWEVPTPARLHLAAASPAPVTHLARSHAWRSRAPPVAPST